MCYPCLSGQSKCAIAQSGQPHHASSGWCPTACMALYEEEEAIRRRLQQCACEAAPEQLRVKVTALIATFRTSMGR